MWAPFECSCVHPHALMYDASLDLIHSILPTSQRARCPTVRILSLKLIRGECSWRFAVPHQLAHPQAGSPASERSPQVYTDQIPAHQSAA
eukprot:COSAG02_NODE_6080_length_3815_cov_25.833961_3_plen_90_part_00